MRNHPLEPHLFYFWTDLNHKLWNDWAALCCFPAQFDVLQSLCFVPVENWNHWMDRFLALQVPGMSILPAVEQSFSESPSDREATADAILADLHESSEAKLPRHKEFETLIYPWHEAEQPIPELHHPTYTEVRKVA